MRQSPLGLDLSQIDPDGGVLYIASYWRPDVWAPNLDMPGQKISIAAFLRVRGNARCPCGSGKRFRDCCRLLPYWRVLCPNPGLSGYAPVAPVTYTFTGVDGAALHAALIEDPRLYCAENTRKRSFWTYWGDPALDDPHYGTFCFGDIELRLQRTLIVTGLSETRATLLHGLVATHSLPPLAPPRIERQAPYTLAKPGKPQPGEVPHVDEAK
jgi:SEC-C motif